MINHIIGEHSKLAQKEYKMIHDWVEKVIPVELYNKSKFDPMNVWYMHNLESILENEKDNHIYQPIRSGRIWQKVIF